MPSIAPTTTQGLAAQKEFYSNVTYLRQLMAGYKMEGVNLLRIWYGHGALLLLTWM